MYSANRARSILLPAAEKRPLNLFTRALLCAVAVNSGYALAQSNQSSGLLEEIVVTATKRSENLQDVPIAITAFSASMIERTGGSSLADMEHAAPSLNFGRGSRRTRGEINIRGVGGFSRNPGADARASVYVDGVFVGRSAVFDQDLQGVQSVEVLRGPQGTLFGKNTISGAININTAKPTEEFSGGIGLELGNYSLTKVQARVNGALADNVFGSFAVTKMDQDGFIDNVFLNTDINGIDRISGRGKLLIAATDDLELNLAFDYLDEEDRGGNGEGIRQDSGLGANFGGLSFSSAPDPRQVDHDAQERESRTFWGASVTADYSFGDDYTLTSITAYRDMEWYNLNEEDYTNQFIGISEFDEFSEQFTQELRISSPKDGTFKYVAGLYYITQDISTGRSGTFAGFLAGQAADIFIPTIVDVKSSGWAAYFNANFDITEQLELTVGVRYTDEEKDINFVSINPTGFARILDMTGQAPFIDTYSADAITPKVGLNWRVSDNFMLYASYSEGFKSGGHNVDFIQTLEELPYAEETAESIEFGLKSTFWDGRARMNLAVFDTTFKDFQVQQFQRLTDTVSRISISNAAEAASQGVEVEFSLAPIKGLTLTANGAFVEAEFDSFPNCNDGVDCTGNKLQYAPESKFFLAAEYEFSVGDRGDNMYVRWEYSYTDNYFTHPENTPVVRAVDSYDVQNARIGYSSADETWKLSAWVKNITDEDDLRMAELNFFGVQRGSYTPPRTYGATAQYNF